MPTYEPDFRLDGYDAVNERVDEAFWQHIDIHQSEFILLADHHTHDGEHSFYVMYDRSATYGMPGEPQIVALHLQRNPQARTFDFSHKVLPLPSMAQSWLIARGCPQETILLPEGMGTAPADQATRSLESRLRGDGDHFALLHSYTDDTSDRPKTTVLLRAVDEKAAMPFRVLLEETDAKARTHTLREGGFATFQAATEWWEAHWNGENVPLPSASPAARRTEASAVSALPSRPAPPRGPSR